MLDNFVRGRRENLAWAMANGPVRARRGRHPRPRAGGRADARHRRGLPPGRDAHHPVRGGAAARARSDGRRHLQRDRGGRCARACAGSSPPPRRRSTASPKQFPTDESHHPYANDTLYGAAKTFNEGLLRSFHAMQRARLRRAALLQRLRPAHGHPRRLHRGARALDGADRGRPAAADLRRRLADDGLRLHRATSPAPTCWRAQVGRQRRGVQRRQRRRDEPARSSPRR